MDKDGQEYGDEDSDQYGYQIRCKGISCPAVFIVPSHDELLLILTRSDGSSSVQHDTTKHEVSFWGQSSFQKCA
jgi:hypothetical protein